MLYCNHLQKRFGEQFPTLSDVTLRFGPSGFYLLLGESGCGKTTLLNLLSGMLSFEAGSIIYEGKEYNQRVPDMLDGDAEYITQDAFFADFLTVEENLKLLGTPDERIREELARFGLEKHADQLPGTLSGGEQARLSLIRALLKGRKVLLVDEPTAALDSDNKHQIFSVLKELGKRVLVICASHDPEARDYADSVVLFEKESGAVRQLDSGRILSASKEESYLNDQTAGPSQNAAVFLRKWLRSGKRERFSRVCFVLIMTLALCLFALADTPEHKNKRTMNHLYHLNILHLIVHDDSMPAQLFPGEESFEAVVDYSESCPSGDIPDPNVLMPALPDYEMTLPALPDDPALFPFAERIAYGTYFTGPNQVILTPEMAEQRYPSHPEKLIGKTITKKIYGLGTVELTIVGILEEMTDAERIYLMAAGADYSYGEEYNPQNHTSLCFVSASTLAPLLDDPDFYSSSGGKQRGYRLYFSSYGEMESFYDHYKAMENEAVILRQEGLPIDYELRWPLISLVLLPSSGMVLLLVALYYALLRKMEYAYHHRFIAVFEYAGYEKKKLLRTLSLLCVGELLREMTAALALAAFLTVIGNRINETKLYYPLRLFSYNPYLLAGFFAILPLFACVYLRRSFRKIEVKSWYEMILATRDLL